MTLAANRIALDDTGLLTILAVSALLIGLAALLLLVATRSMAASRRTEDSVRRRNLQLRAGGSALLSIGACAVWYALYLGSPPRGATLNDDALVLHYRRSDVAIPWKDIKDATYTTRKSRRGGETHQLVIETTSGDRRIQVSSTEAAEGLQALRREIQQRTRGPLVKIPPFKLNLGTKPATQP